MPLNTSTTYHAPPPLLQFFFCQHTYRKNVYRDEGVILSLICWGPGAPLPFSRPQTQTPPPPALKLAGKWEGVGVWPVATPPPPRVKAHVRPKECLNACIPHASLIPYRFSHVATDLQI